MDLRFSRVFGQPRKRNKKERKKRPRAKSVPSLDFRVVTSADLLSHRHCGRFHGDGAVRACRPGSWKNAKNVDLTAGRHRADRPPTPPRGEFGVTDKQSVRARVRSEKAGESPFLEHDAVAAENGRFVQGGRAEYLPRLPTA